MIFCARQFEFVFPRPVLVMGIVNVTPDSFSDGGKFLDANAAVAHALKLAGQGAEILDIGGESTRPGAEPVGEDEELRRVIPVIEKLAAIRWGERPREPRLDKSHPAREDARPTKKIPISIDTMKPAVARAALQAGASIVNDVAASRENDAMWKVVSEFGAGYICMHAPGRLPAVRQNPSSVDVVREVAGFFLERLTVLLNEAGIAAEQVALDPGIGFGKTTEENLQLLAGLRQFTKLNRPLLVGVSRKSFIGKLSGAPVNERLPASLACAILAVESGAQIIRAHDVAETVQAVRMAEAIWAK
jgi:dihydropteroate synthase